MALEERVKRLEEAVVPKTPLLVLCCAKGHPYTPIPPDFKGQVIQLSYGYRPCECQTNEPCTSSSMTVS